MNLTIITLFQSMTLDYADMHPQILWAETASTVISIKKYLSHSAYQLKIWPYTEIFGNKPSNKYWYSFGAKCYVHIAEENQIRISKLFFKRIKYYIIGYTASTKIL
jgi:hypothetical protein